jgi:hypothetical protein
VHEIVVYDAAGSAVPTGTITLTYTDLYGGVWTTQPITVDTNIHTNIASALTALPNGVIESISCVKNPDLDGTAGADNSYVAAADISTFGYVVHCTFTGDQNAGVQNTMTVNMGGCTRAGCSPLYAGTNIVTKGATADVTTNAAYAGTTDVQSHKEAAICSEHGLCDTETGLCECFSGYFDEDCSKQTVLV